MLKFSRFNMELLFSLRSLRLIQRVWYPYLFLSPLSGPPFAGLIATVSYRNFCSVYSLLFLFFELSFLSLSLLLPFLVYSLIITQCQYMSFLKIVIEYCYIQGKYTAFSIDLVLKVKVFLRWFFREAQQWFPMADNLHIAVKAMSLEDDDPSPSRIVPASKFSMKTQSVCWGGWWTRIASRWNVWLWTCQEFGGYMAESEV